MSAWLGLFLPEYPPFFEVNPEDKAGEPS